MPTPLTPEQKLLIDMWLSDLDIPQPDAGLYSWTAATVVTSMARQLHERLQGKGYEASYEAITDHILEIMREATAREWADDLCQWCGAKIGAGVRLMHLGICDACKEKQPS